MDSVVAEGSSATGTGNSGATSPAKSKSPDKLIRELLLNQEPIFVRLDNLRQKVSPTSNARCSWRKLTVHEGMGQSSRRRAFQAATEPGRQRRNEARVQVLPNYARNR
jgi:hypothetical protein